MSIDSLAPYIQFNQRLFPELTPELGGHIISSYLGDVTLLEMTAVCSRWRSIIDRVTWNQRLQERGFDPAKVSYGEYVRDLNRLWIQLFPSIDVFGANVFEVQENMGVCDAETLRIALVGAARAGDFTKVVMLFDMGVTSSVDVCKKALPNDEPNQISAEIFVRLVKDLPPNIEILNAARSGFKSAFIKPTLLAWKGPALTATDSHWECILQDAVTAEDLDYAKMLMKMGVKVKEFPDRSLANFIGKIPQREMSDSLELFELIFACGVVPTVIDLVMILKSSSLSENEMVRLMEIFLKAGKFTSDDLMNHFSFGRALLNSKIVNEVIKLLDQNNVRPSAKFLNDGLCMNVFSIDSIQWCLRSGLTLSEENLSSLAYILAHPEKSGGIADQTALAKLQLFAGAGVQFDEYILFTFLEKTTPIEIIQFICNQGVMPSRYMISRTIHILPLEYLQVLIEAGGQIDLGLIRETEKHSQEKAEYLKKHL